MDRYVTKNHMHNPYWHMKSKTLICISICYLTLVIGSFNTRWITDSFTCSVPLFITVSLFKPLFYNDWLGASLCLPLGMYVGVFRFSWVQFIMTLNTYGSRCCLGSQKVTTIVSSRNAFPFDQMENWEQTWQKRIQITVLNCSNFPAYSAFVDTTCPSPNPSTGP